MTVLNYDFGNNWDKIVKHLTYPKVNKWIKKTFDEMCPIDKYSKNISPAELFSTGDSYATFIMDVSEIIYNGNYPEIILEKEKKK